ncbi:hypothetical protein AB0O75_20605 [Streptomyces sp. NPDC088921]
MLEILGAVIDHPVGTELVHDAVFEAPAVVGYGGAEMLGEVDRD